MMSVRHSFRRVPLIFYAAASLLISSSVWAADSGTGCKACVSDGCKFCKGVDFFDNPDVCVCPYMILGGNMDYGSYYGSTQSCDSTSFGSLELNSKADCTFGTSGGEAIQAVLLVIAIGVFICCLCCCFLAANNMSPETKYPVHVQPAYTGTNGLSISADAATSPAYNPSAPIREQEYSEYDTTTTRDSSSAAPVYATAYTVPDANTSIPSYEISFSGV